MTKPPVIDDEVIKRVQAMAGLAAPQDDVGPIQAPDTPQMPNVSDDVIRRVRASAVNYNRIMVGGEEGRMAMFPDEYSKTPDDVPGIWDRGFKGITLGFTSMAPATMTLAGGILEFMGADDLGNDLAQSGISLGEFLNDHLAVENPTLFDYVANGVGSMATFLIPGLGAAGLAGKGAQAIGLAGKGALAFRALTGGTAMAFLESAVEQSQRQQELMAHGQTAGEAMANSEGVFWQNMAILTATNTAEFFLPLPIKNKYLSKAVEAVKAAFIEGGQERAQSVIQDVAAGRGEFADFFDKSKYGMETAVGAIVGSGATLFLPGEAAQDSKKKKPSADETEQNVDEFDQPLPDGFDEFQDTEEADPREIGGPVEGEPPLPRPGEETSQPVVDEAVKAAPQSPPDESAVDGDGLKAEIFERGDENLPFGVRYIDEESGEDLGIIDFTKTREQAQQKAEEFLTGKQAGQSKGEPRDTDVAPARVETPQDVQRRLLDKLDSQALSKEEHDELQAANDEIGDDEATGLKATTTTKERLVAEAKARANTAQVETKKGAPTPENIYDKFSIGGVNYDSRKGFGAVPDQGNDYKGYVVFMKPSDFLDLNPGRERPLHGETADAIRSGESVAPPFVQVRYEDGVAKIVQHEGRGRVSVINEISPGKDIPVVVFPPSSTPSKHLTKDQVLSALKSDTKRGAKDHTVKPSRIIWNGEDIDSSKQAPAPEQEPFVNPAIDEPIKEDSPTPATIKSDPIATIEAEAKKKAAAKKAPPVTGYRASVSSDDGVSGNLSVHLPGRKKFHPGDIGTWFAVDRRGRPGSGKTAASGFGNVLEKNSGKTPSIRQASLNISNPRVYSSYDEFMSDVGRYKSGSKFQDRLSAQGYDGIRILESRTDSGVLREDWVAFDSSQIEYQDNAAASPKKRGAGSKQSTTSKKSKPTVAEEVGVAASTKRAKGIELLPTAALTVEPDLLQTRTNIDNHDSGTNEARLQEIQSGFKPEKMGLVVAWRDPSDGKLKVLDGHHTLEIAKRNGIKEVNVKMFSGTFEEAVQESKDLNDRVANNDIFSRVENIRSHRERGKSEDELDLLARAYGKDRTTVLALSHLNPKGKLMSALKALYNSPDSSSRVEQYGRWIGELRGEHPTLTNQHENEMFDYLNENGNKPGLTTVGQFTDFIMDRGVLGDFSGSESLNLKKAGVTQGVQGTFDQKVKQKRSEIDAIKRERTKKVKTYKERLKSSTDEAETSRLNKAIKKIKAQYQEEIDFLEADINRMKIELREKQDAGIDQQAMFFSTKLGKPNLVTVHNVASKSNQTVLNEYGIDEGSDLGKQIKPQDDHDRMLASIAKRFGVEIVFFNSSYDTGGFYLNGDKGRVFLNKNETEYPHLVILGHEIGHYMEQHHYEEWDKITRVLAEIIGDKEGGKALRGYMMKLIPTYGLTGAARELPSDAIGAAFASEEFWNKLRAEDKSLWADLLNMLNQLLHTIRATVLKEERYLPQYIKDFGAIEKLVAEQMAKVSAKARADLGIETNPVQTDLFSYTKPDEYEQGALFFKARTAEAQRRIDQLEAAKDRKSRLNSRTGKNWFRWVYQKMWDKNTQVYVAARNTAKAKGLDVENYDVTKRPDKVLQTMIAWTSKVDQALNSGVFSWDGSDHLGPGFTQIIKKFGLAKHIDTGEFGQYVIAARIVAMHKKLGDAFFGKEEIGDGEINPEYELAKQEFEASKKLVKDYDALESGWAKAVKEFSDWSNNIMTRLLQSGAISQKQYDGLTGTYDIYAPLYVLEEENVAGSPNKPKPTAGRVTYAMDKLIPGLTRQDPMESYIKNAYRLEFLMHNNHAKLTAANWIMDLAGKTKKGVQRTSLAEFGRRVQPKVNPVTKKVDELLKAAGLNKEEIKQLEEDGLIEDIEATAKLWVQSSFLDNGVVALMRDGEIEYWHLEPDIYDAYAAIGQASSHPMMKFITFQTKLLRAGAVLTPEFMTRNQFRDMFAAGVLSKHLVKNPYDFMMLFPRIVKGLSHAIKKDQVWIDFINSGAAFANLVALDQENLQKNLQELNRSGGGVSFRWDQFKKNPAKYIVHSHPLTVLQALSKLTENSTRLAVFEKTRADMLAQGMGKQEAGARAAIEAREASTDFGRSGEYAQVINRMIPFFNATLQGNDKMMRALFRDKGNRKATWVRGGLMITLPSVLLWALNHDEDWYKEQPLWLKNMFWLFSIDRGKTIHKVPKPFEVGLLFGSLPERFLDWSFDRDPKAMKSWLSSLRKSFVTMDPVVIAGPMMTSLNEINSNYDRFRDAPIVKGWLQDLEPKAQYTSNTSEFAKWLGENYPGRGLSPLMIDHFVRGSFGGVGTWAAEIASNIIMKADPKRLEMKPSSRLIYDTMPDWTPIMRAVTITTPNRYTRQMNEFYRAYDSSEEAVNTLRSYASGGATEDDYIEFFRRRAVDITMHEALVRGAEAMGQVSRQIKTIEMAPPTVLNRRQKQRKIDELMGQRNKMIEAYMKELNAVDKDEIRRQVEKSTDRVREQYRESKRR